MDAKKEVRKYIKERWTAFSADAARMQKEEADIWEAVELSGEFAAARTVLVYMDIEGEVPTREFIARWSGIKRIVLPLVTEGDDLVMKEYDPEKLHPGFKGIMEPSDNAPDVSPDEINLALIPGIAFTRDGARLGRGGGYYDRLIPRLNCPCWGLSYSCRIVESLPVDPWDGVLDRVITSR